MTHDTINKDEMATLSSCMATLSKRGYTDNFKIEKGKLYASSTDKSYEAEQLEIENFYRFEGESDPADSSVLYAIKTDDGARGLIVEAYGAYSDEEHDKFIKKIEEMRKQKA